VKFEYCWRRNQTSIPRRIFELFEIQEVNTKTNIIFSICRERERG
jgi:hypothetical protein